METHCGSSTARRAHKVVKVAIRVAAHGARVVPETQAALAAVVEEVVACAVWRKSWRYLARHALFATRGHERPLAELRVLAQPQ